jgi:diguanylate cyclase (GGDEF)-like protein
VDDDPSVIALLKRALEAEGLEVVTASSRAQADAEIERGLPEGVIVDIVLADGSGYELVERIRARPGGEILPVLVISRLGDFLDKVEAIHCGADGYFEKPLDWEGLVHRLRLLLGRHDQESGKVLVVEDEVSQAGFLRAVLESAGYVVKICADPKRFETELISFGPDLVTMDIHLPGILGYDLVRFVRQDPRYATLPIIALTTETQTEARVKVARSGGDEYLSKPVQPNLLLSVVAARIERARVLNSLLDRDGLTGLLTHTAFLERLKNVVSTRSRGDKRSAILVMLDLDHFKRVNDVYGHPVGDRVLVALATLLRRRLRGSDTIGRYGGEEFVLLLEGLGEEEVLRLLGRLREEFADLTHQAGERTFQVTFSAGLAFLRAEETVDGWKDRADKALYVAKGAGRNRVATAPAAPSLQ